MSTMCANCEKTTTRCFARWSLTSSRSRTRSLPEAATSSSSVVCSGSDSASGKRNGWQHVFRSCIRRFSNDLYEPALAFDADACSRSTRPSAEWSFNSSARYQKSCCCASGHWTTVSSFGGRPASTSVLRRRSINLERSRCAFPSAARSTTPRPRSYALSKTVLSGSASGCKKFNSAQSSARLFCKGVPVRSNAVLKCIFRTVLESSVSAFFMTWPSSKTNTRHVSFWTSAVRSAACLAMS
mmetsp:Transcript_8025/g.23820  ORF Transcript_8025/g.23820 Transcript_8025/m.23820 type:complete len:241 (+) Transcript_8025:156-878(+)